MDLKGKAYAQVKDRLQQFWKENPRGSVKTTPDFLPDGRVRFSAHIIKDKKEPASADATGHSFGKTGQKEKDFEKLETIAVGRALALLGYASDGEIASSEEMEEFHQHQEEKHIEAVLAATEKLTNAKSLSDLQKIWAALPGEMKKELEATKNKLKTRYEKPPVRK
ncbi:MAG: hypothetical protein ACK4UO_12945 [Pseudolabrys sp.]